MKPTFGGFMKKWLLLLVLITVIQYGKAQTHSPLFITGSYTEFTLENAGDIPLPNITCMLHCPSFPDMEIATTIPFLRAGEKRNISLKIPQEVTASHLNAFLHIYSNSKMISERKIFFTNAAPANFQLQQNYPNSFNAATVIAYSIPQSANNTKAVLSIYDVAGKLITTIFNTVVQTGKHTVSWSGTDSEGKAVASGTYYYQLTVGALQETRKLVYVK